jgi:hypothetical protein
MMRTFNSLVERTIDKLMKDKKKGVLPDVDKEGFAAAAERVARDPERTYLLGAGVAASIAPARTWSEKVARLLDLADAAPQGGPAKTFALQTIQQPLAEILESKVGIADLLGHDLDLGGSLAAMTRLAAAGAVDMLIKADPSLAAVMPRLSEPAERLARWLATDDFQEVRAALGRRILRELNGPRRLRPADAIGEIAILRALAMALTAASGQLLPPDDVQAAFVARSKMLVTSEFVESYLGPDHGVIEEAKALIWLVENVIGAANKRQAGRWLAANIVGLRFEKEMRNSPETPSARLQRLADLQKGVQRCGLAPEDCEVIHQKLGELGGMIEGDVKLTATVAKASASPIHRLMLLLRLATGEAAPLGPAADRARAEAMKLVRLPETRSELAGSPERFDQVRDLINRAGLAA